MCFAVACSSARVDRTETPRPGLERSQYETNLQEERNRNATTLVKSAEEYDQAVRAWHQAAQRSLRERLEIPPVFREVVRFNGLDAYAVGYRIAMHRGQRLNVELRRRGGSGHLFAEVFEEIPPSDYPMYRLVHSLSTDDRQYAFEANTTGPHVLRLQPELGASNEWEVTISVETDLKFPVANVTEESIRSVFGDSRDGGRRDHAGVDIFAPRGTPVVAVADGLITTVKNGGLGGKVVWQRDDERSTLYYYAHLDQQLVRRGQYVRAGDTIATVGNTGNARRSSPHLHFGVYRSAAVAIDPLPYLNRAGPAAPEPVRADVSSLGRWLTVGRDAVGVRASPDSTAPVIHEIARDDRILVVGAASDWHRVRLEDGRSGFISGAMLY